MSSPIDRLRGLVSDHPTPALVDVVEELEDQSGMTDDERIIYAIACAVLARRLDLDAKWVAGSLIGPAAAFRTASMT